MERSFLVLIFLGVIWGINFIFMKLAVQVVSPVQVAWLRAMFGAVPLVLMALAYRKLRLEHLKQWRHFFVMGFLSVVVPYLSLIKGTQLLQSGIAGAMSGTISLVTTVFALLFLPEERMNPKKLLGLLLGFWGVALIANLQAVIGADANPTLIEGAAYMLLAAVGYAAAAVYAKKHVMPLGVSAMALACYQTVCAAILLTVIVPFAGLGAILNDTRVFLSVSLGLGLTGTGMAFVMYFYIIEKLGAVTASSVFYIPPLVALAVGVFVAGEQVQAIQLCGAALVLLGVWVSKPPARCRIKE